MKEPFRELWEGKVRELRKGGMPEEEIAIRRWFAEWGWDKCHEEQVRRMLASIDDLELDPNVRPGT